jgi:hypothetical protein
MYSPQRDLAHIGPALLKAAVSQVTTVPRDPLLQAEMDELGITEAALGEAVTKFADAYQHYLNPTVKHPNHAFEHTGFDKLPVGIRNFLYSAMGRVSIGAWFWCIRDATLIGDTMPPAEELAQLISMGREIGRSSGYPDAPFVPHEAALILANQRIEALSLTVEQQRKQLKTLREEQKLAAPQE